MKNIFVLLLVILITSCISEKKEKPRFLPIYGNYCGSGNPNVLANLDPISTTDYLCGEWLSCQKKKRGVEFCTKYFLESAKKVSTNDAKEKAMRDAIIAYFE